MHIRVQRMYDVTDGQLAVEHPLEGRRVKTQSSTTADVTVRYGERSPGPERFIEASAATTRVLWIIKRFLSDGFIRIISRDLKCENYEKKIRKT
ncbi:hypothetical protein F2P81_021683 [Scophthalmus maximus]|uniref:Uncharacterized protein n=1 Tax=Scophthalmus maximus TaxID=52904 RepID=A0A6A4RW10_SCOMX|nr:hypothetical protein F2P81_021683 [Scophthalmus maximus]